MTQLPDDDREVLVQRAVFGKQVDNFMSSDIGRYLLHRAHALKADAQEEFRTNDLTNMLTVGAIQRKIHVADCIESWLEEAVGDGLRALNILDDRE